MKLYVDTDNKWNDDIRKYFYEEELSPLKKNTKNWNAVSIIVWRATDIIAAQKTSLG